MYKQPISTLTAISAGTIFKSRRQISKHSIVLDSKKCIENGKRALSHKDTH